MKLVFLAFLVIAFNFSAFSQTQMEMNADACSSAKKADEKMNKIYAQILKEYKNDRVFIEKIKKAQRAWLVFRDAEMEAIFPPPTVEDGGYYKYGSVYPMCACIWEENYTNERIKQLEKWTKGIEEGDVCSGSIKLIYEYDKRELQKRSRNKKKGVKKN
jgi:uncharacterized protein YecT (DUF1311 family)